MEHQTAVVYGIANCDSVKKARAWLGQHQVAYTFVDFKKVPPTPELLALWAAQLGWSALLNRQGTTWRKLSAAQQASASDAASTSALMLAQPSLIKRPVIAWPASQGKSQSLRLTVGFKPEQWPER